MCHHFPTNCQQEVLAGVSRGQDSFAGSRILWSNEMIPLRLVTNWGPENYQLFHLSCPKWEAEAIRAHISNYSRLSTIYHSRTHGLPYKGQDCTCARCRARTHQKMPMRAEAQRHRCQCDATLALCVLHDNSERLQEGMAFSGSLCLPLWHTHTHLFQY